MIVNMLSILPTVLFAWKRIWHQKVVFRSHRGYQISTETTWALLRKLRLIINWRTSWQTTLNPGQKALVVKKSIQGPLRDGR